MKKRLIMLLLAVALPMGMSAQKVALKTNLAHWASVTPNLALEVALGPRVTMDLYGAYNSFDVAKHAKWHHWIAQPELRIWTCESFNGLFFGIHAQGGAYNLARLNIPRIAWTGQEKFIPGLKDVLNEDGTLREAGRRYEGYYVGGGISIGYQWLLGKRWNIELSAGGGYNYTWFKKFGGNPCDSEIPVSPNTAHYVGPTKLTLSIAYFFK